MPDSGAGAVAVEEEEGWERWVVDLWIVGVDDVDLTKRCAEVVCSDVLGGWELERWWSFGGVHVGFWELGMLCSLMR